MATTQTSGGQSPKSFSRTLEKSFDDARHTGVINLSNRKLRDFPRSSKKYDLSDTTGTDMSKNRFGEIPPEVCDLHSLEHLSVYSNVLKCIPQAIIQLQSLVHLNLSRNQLSYIPDFICQLKQLQVLLASNNRLVSMPEEIGQLRKLMDLDISCNEITHLPPQIGELESLRSLNVRRNLLVELPTEICQLQLQRLDVSDNRISTIPNEYCHMDTLDDIQLQNNPLTSPPAQVCRKGRIHIMKYLEKEAVKEDRKRGVLSQLDIKTNVRSSALPHSLSDEFQSLDSSLSDRRLKRRTVDSGYSTTDSSERSVGSRFSPSEYTGMYYEPVDPGYEMYNSSTLPRSGRFPVTTTGTLSRALRRLQNNFTEQGVTESIVSTPQTIDRDSLIIQPAEQRHDSTERRTPTSTMALPAVVNTTSPVRAPFTNCPLLNTSPPGVGDNIRSPDEFTRELQKQKNEYESRKKRAEMMKVQMEQRDVNSNGADNMYDREREETRRAAIKVQEEQKAMMDRQRELHNSRLQQHNNGNVLRPHRLTVGNNYYPIRSTANSHLVSGSHGNGMTTSPLSSMPGYTEYQQPPIRKVQHSGSFKEEKQTSNGSYSNRYYRRTVSETKYLGDRQEDYEEPVTPTTPTPDGIEYREITRTDVHEIPVEHYTSSQQTSPQQTNYNQSQQLNYSQSQRPPEFRRRREALITQQRHEAQLARRKLEEEKVKLRQRQKDAVMNYVSKRGGPGHNDSSSDSSTFSFSRDSTPNTSFDANSIQQNTANTDIGTPPNYQKALDKLEAMSSELNNTKPGFTVRRQLEQYNREGEQIELLRQIIEGCLKVKLPDDLPSALRDGVVLCHLANHIRPRSISSIHVPSPAVPKLSAAKCRRNVENFLQACQQIGVREEYLCPAQAIVEENGIPYLTITVQCLLSCASKVQPQQSTV